MRKQKYKINSFGILNAQYHFVKIASLKELLINTIEYEFNYYSSLIELLDNKIFNNCFITYNVYDRLIVENKIENFKPNIGFHKDDVIDDNYKLVFNESFRRI